MPVDGVKRILVVEDNPVDVSLIEEALHEHGVRYEIAVVDDGQAALDHLEHLQEKPRPDLIILDLNLPKRDGVEVLLEYRMTLSLCSVPIIVLTSSDAPSDRLRTTAIGVSAFLRKPMDLHDFIALGARFKEILETPYSYTGPPGENH